MVVELSLFPFTGEETKALKGRAIPIINVFWWCYHYPILKVEKLRPNEVEKLEQVSKPEGEPRFEPRQSDS